MSKNALKLQKMSQSPSSTEFKLPVFDYKQLTEFHHGLVYGFDPEGTTHEYSANQFEYAVHAGQQYQDVMNAYLYAQNEILPTIRQVGIAKISKALLIEWTNQIHQRIAKTLAIDLATSAGQFTDQQVLRWHPSTDMQNIVHFALADKITKPQLSIAAQEIGADAKVINRFLVILNKIDADPTIVLSKEQLPQLPQKQPYLKIVRVLNKLAVAFHQKKLTAQELAIINQVVTISTLPKEIPDRMEKFATELLAKWQSCEKEDLDQIAELAFFAFYHLTEIHPYFNCNGRTATCLMNIILRSLGQPSILMRYPSERDDKNSSYSQAITKINSHPQLLVQHIKTRLLECAAYEDSTLSILISQRVKFAHNFIKLTKYYSANELNQHYAKWTKVAEDKISPYSLLLTKYSPSADGALESILLQQYNQLMSEYNQPPLLIFSLSAIHHGMAILGLTYYIVEQEKLFVSASSSAVNSFPGIPISPIIVHRPTPPEIKTIISKLQSLTGQADWKAYKGGTIFLLTMDLAQEALAGQMVTALQKTNCLQAKLMHERDGSKRPVVQLTQIQLTKLLSIEKLTDFTIDVDSAQLSQDLQQVSL